MNMKFVLLEISDSMIYANQLMIQLTGVKEQIIESFLKFVNYFYYNIIYQVLNQKIII